MYKEYFITTPLILNRVTFYSRECTIQLGSTKAKCCIEGPSEEAVGIAIEDFRDALSETAQIPFLRVWLRNPSEQIGFPNNPRLYADRDWISWIFSQIPLDSIPGIKLSSKECNSVQREIDNNRALNI